MWFGLLFLNYIDKECIYVYNYARIHECMNAKQRRLYIK